MSDEQKKTPAVNEDLQMLLKLVICAVVVLTAAAVFGLAVRIFLATSGFGG